MAKKKKNDGGQVAVGMGIAAVAAVAALGTYFFYGSKNSKKNRRNLKSWMVKAQAEIMEKMESLEHVSQEAYDQMVEDVVAGYKKLQHVDPAELALLASELHGYWGKMSRSLAKNKKRAGKAFKKIGKRK